MRRLKGVRQLLGQALDGSLPRTRFSLSFPTPSAPAARELDENSGDHHAATYRCYI